MIIEIYLGDTQLIVKILKSVVYYDFIESVKCGILFACLTRSNLGGFHLLRQGIGQQKVKQAEK